MKHSRPLATVVCLGILLAGLAAQAAPQQASTFTNRCNGDAFRIDLAELLDVELGQDDDERIEQLRDWIWQILLGRLEATTDLEDLLMGSATQPLVRDDALADVLDQPVGGTRSVTARGGAVVVMLEHGEPAAMHEALLEAVDQEALRVGATPEDVVVYRYVVDERAGYADLCRIGTFHAAWIESPQQGFRRQTVRSASALASFLDGGVDLLTAQCTAQGLELTGRTRPRARKAPITVEHIAALRQEPRAGYVSYVPSAQLGVPVDETLSDALRAQLAISATLIERAAILQAFQLESRILLDELAWRAYAQVRDWRLEHPRVPTEELLLSWYVQNHPRAPGFSLDPGIRASEVVQSLDALIAALDDPPRLAALLLSWKVDPSVADWMMAEVGGARESLRRELLALRDTLATSTDEGALGVLRRGQFVSGTPALELAAAAAKFIEERDGYQCAHYDGDLRGTLTGMTMFYTDLLMKLWGSDLFGTAPEGLLAGFESTVSHGVSSAYCAEDEQPLSATRAWLGLREEQHVRERTERSRFAPVVTRAFARSSMYGPEYGAESKVTARDQRFYRWWNAHYASIAAWEPQYELLNQIMKWSVVAQASASSEHGNCMAFLRDAPVSHEHRFGRWVEDQEDLSWRGPVPLVQRDDEPAECLPILRSRWFPHCDSELYISGGVRMPSFSGRIGGLGSPVRVGGRATASTARRMIAGSGPRGRAGRLLRARRLDTAAAMTRMGLAKGVAGPASVSRAAGKLQDISIDPGQRVFTARIPRGTSQHGARHTWLTGSSRGGQPVTRVRKAWRFQDGALEGHASINDAFGVAHLRVDDIARAVARPHLTRLSTVRVRTIGETAAARLASGEASLDQIAADLPDVAGVWRNAESVLVRLAGPRGGAPRYALINANGIRGPPGSLVGRFGARDARGPGQVVEIWMMREREAHRFIAAHHLTEMAMGGPLTKLQSALEASLAEVDIGKARHLIGEIRAVTQTSYTSLRNAIERARLGAVRLRRNARPFEKLLVENGIASSRPAGLTRESNVLPVDGKHFYVPRQHARQYAELVALPAGKNPLSAPDVVAEAFHAQVIAEAAMLQHPPAVIQQHGIEYVRIDRGDLGATMEPGRTYAIHPCRSTDDEARSDDTVPCHGRTSARQMDEVHRQNLLRQACQGDAQAWAFGVNGCQQLRDRERVSLRGRR